MLIAVDGASDGGLGLKFIEDDNINLVNRFPAITKGVTLIRMKPLSEANNAYPQKPLARSSDLRSSMPSGGSRR